MLKQILHRYVIVDNFTKKMSDWVDVSNLTISQIKKISKELDNNYPNNWYVEIKRIEA